MGCFSSKADTRFQLLDSINSGQSYTEATPVIVSHDNDIDFQADKSLNDAASKICINGTPSAALVLVLKASSDFSSKKISAIHGCAGVRQRDSTVSITSDDVFHLGSCTKAMTGVLCTILIEKKILGANTNVSSRLVDIIKEPNIAKNIGAKLAVLIESKLRDVTLCHLLTHSAGLREWKDDHVWRFGWSLEPHRGTPYSYEKTTQDRGRYLTKMLENYDADLPIGSDGPPYKFAYSNEGYNLAGHLFELATNTYFEELMRREIFVPLGMASANFGPPGEFETHPIKRKTDFVWGHPQNDSVTILDPRGTNPSPDNPRIYSPCGRAHCTIEDWAKFMSIVIDYEHCKRVFNGLISEESWRSWQQGQTREKQNNYSPGGWFAVQRSWQKPPMNCCLNHTGSNSMWYCSSWATSGFASLVMTNSGGPANTALFERMDEAHGSAVRTLS